MHWRHGGEHKGYGYGIACLCECKTERYGTGYLELMTDEGIDSLWVDYEGRSYDKFEITRWCPMEEIIEELNRREKDEVENDAQQA